MMNPMTDQEYRQAAKDRYGRGGEIEIDDDANVSRSHNHGTDEPCHNADTDGAYVQAWVYVAEKE